MSTETQNQITYRCLVASRDNYGNVSSQVQVREHSKQPLSEVTIRVAYSSLNYKDALAATGHPGVARVLPLVPGIDAAGQVVSSQSTDFDIGEHVLVIHPKFGTESDGGYSEFISVPATWVYRLPQGMSMLTAMTIGTGGFTAAQCVDALLRHHVQPDQGEIVVSGATGGVGIFAIKLLAKLGFRVVAATGKKHLADWLKQHGAQEVITREALDDREPKPLLNSRWAGAVDTVGGNTLSTIIRSTRPHGCVTACGLVGGADLSLTVFPFILRGVTLQGIDTTSIPREYRIEVWNRLAGEWHLPDIDKLATVIKLDQLNDEIARILKGDVAGRVVVSIEPQAG